MVGLVSDVGGGSAAEFGASLADCVGGDESLLEEGADSEGGFSAGGGEGGVGSGSGEPAVEGGLVPD